MMRRSGLGIIPGFTRSLRRGPAAQLRFLFAGLSQLICNFFKDLLPSDEGVADDARADIAG
jgi:hypothetical protein